MAKDHAANLRQLHKRIGDLNKALGRLRLERKLKDLYDITRRPGWTTPAEFIFALGAVEGMLGQVAVLQQLGDSLLTGSRAAGRA